MNTPKVTVMVPHHLNLNDNYLKVCLEGLAASKGIDYEAFIVSSTEKRPQYEPRMPNFSYLWDPTLYTTKRKFDMIMTVMSKQSTHLMILSDDVIVSQHTLASMYECFRGRDMIVNPMSNSDFGTRYETAMVIDEQSKKQLKPDMSLEDLSPKEIDKLMRLEKATSLLIPFPWLSFYCTMIPKTVWDKLTGLDEKLEYRHNDQDFCMRAMQVGIPSVINFGAFAFHFGSRTLKYESDETKNKCTEYFLQKWKAKT